MNTITLKRSDVAGKKPQPTQLNFGELALNYADGRLYYKNKTNEIKSIGSELTIAKDSINHEFVLPLVLNADSEMGTIGQFKTTENSPTFNSESGIFIVPEINTTRMVVADYVMLPSIINTERVVDKSVSIADNAFSGPVVEVEDGVVVTVETSGVWKIG